MGCCASTPSSPYPAQEGHSSSRAITSSQPESQSALPRPSTNASSHSNHQPRPAHYLQYGHPRPGNSAETSARNNTGPLKQPKKWKTKPGVTAWTRESLDSEREAFFDTRVTGRPEIWLAIRSALELLWAGGDPGDEDGGIGTAQSILDAAGVVMQHGDMTKLVYDSFGGLYELPKHIISDPENLAPSPAPMLKNDDERSKEDGESEEMDEDEVLRRREEKGKAVINEADMVVVKVRFSDGALPDHSLRLGKDDSVRLLIRRVVEEVGLAPPKRIKIVYMGRILVEGKSLIDQGWNAQEEHVLSALVFDS
ncbi:Uncharacterized protein LHYA1_G004592 [Lachnellula hyalina]|uniref:DC-UbP/UBTD2 N-terminal domain-containing protein n=1 Tax=Lachnellula hyalina TaxID=1316788 RepID=A0A8H8TXA7_9HELO|nr:Uncharacterized protein LHYA1_G004592 [Lachnellula hyalina]TVY25809.1 Uncharacterized protein LHYA1_G004592 [Lachnellula hyalina]